MTERMSKPEGRNTAAAHRAKTRLRGFKKGSGTVVRSTLRAVPATVPDPFLNHAYLIHSNPPQTVLHQAVARQRMAGDFDHKQSRSKLLPERVKRLRS